MSDIEDELLALAGGDVSSDEEEVGSRGRRPASRSPTPPAAATSIKDTPTSKGTALKTAAKKARKGQSDDESVGDEVGEKSEEGPAPAPGSPDSQQSVPMDESDSDSEAPQSKAPGEEDEKKYPYEGLFTDAAEKSRIMAMREIEREQILAERREIHERARQRQVLRQLMENRKEESKKRKLSFTELDDGQRKTSRVRTKVGGTKVGETSSGMDNLRRAREERNNQIRKRERENDNDRRKTRSPEYRRSVDHDEGPDSEDDWQRPSKTRRKSDSPTTRESTTVVLRDYERARISRAGFAQVCFFPGFEEAVKGCYFRLSLGPDAETQENKYRMCLIKGITKGKPYALPATPDRHIVVDHYATLAYGKFQKDTPFIMCSNSNFTEDEWRRYRDICMADNIDLPKKQTLLNKTNDVNKLINRSWTEVELVEKINRQNSLRMKFSPVHREKLEKKIAEAKIAKEPDLAARLQAELDAMEIPRLAYRTSLAPTKKSSGSGDIAKVLAAQEESVRLREEKFKRLKEEEDAARRRVKTSNSTSWMKKKLKEAAASKAGSPASGGAETLDPNATVLALMANVQELQRQSMKKGIPTIHRPLMDDDIIGALDLDIDVEL